MPDIATITLTLSDGLSPEEREALKQTLIDALGEFADHREPVASYIARRYPIATDAFRARKASEVRMRIELARRLLQAAQDATIIAAAPRPMAPPPPAHDWTASEGDAGCRRCGATRLVITQGGTERYDYRRGDRVMTGSVEPPCSERP